MPVLRLLLTVLLLLFCLVPLGRPLGIVLCFGADGHIALEPMHDRVPSTSSSMARVPLREQAAKRLDAVEHTAPCSDVTFFASESDGPLLPTSETSPQPAAPVFMPAFLSVPASAELPELSACPRDSRSTNHTLTILRSVVLRI